MQVDDASGRILFGWDNLDPSSGLADWFATEFGRANDPVWICPSAPIPLRSQRIVVGWNPPDYFVRDGVHDGNFWGTVNSAWGFFAPKGVSDASNFYWPFGLYPGYSQPRWVVSSYAFNFWFGDYLDADARGKREFEYESSVSVPSLTPLLVEGVEWFTAPSASDLPATDLLLGFGGGPTLSAMRRNTIPRHGSRPCPVPRNHPPQDRLPGAINVSSYDGHVEQVPLERLWQLYWQKDYTPPAKRPGLP